MKILFPFLIVFAVFFASCSPVGGYKEIVKFDDYKMPKDSVFTFEFNNEDPTQLYDVSLMFRYATGFQFQQMVFELTHNTSVSDGFPIYIGVQTVDKDYKYLGDGSGDLWDIEQKILKSQALPKGKNSFLIKSGMPQDFVPLVMAVGVKIKPCK